MRSLGRYARGNVPDGLLAALERPELLVAPASAGVSRRPTRPVLDAAVARTYLANGAGVGWRVSAPDGWRVAVDAEHRGQSLPPHVLARSGMGEDPTDDRVLAAWTQAEVLAKLTDTPILLRLREFGLGLADLGEHEPVCLHSWRTDDLVVTVGAHRSAPSGLSGVDAREHQASEVNDE